MAQSGILLLKGLRVLDRSLFKQIMRVFQKVISVMEVYICCLL